MPRVHRLCAYAVIGLGLIHAALTGWTNGAWISPRALFFEGAGLAILLLGLMNLILLEAGGDPRVRALCHIANFSGVAFFAVGIVALPLPQVFALFALMLFQLCSGFALIRCR